MTGEFTGIAPTQRVECAVCDGAGTVVIDHALNGSRLGSRKCRSCNGECYVDVDLTTDERLERSETHLGIGWAS